jgi:glycosyltransferase involved in cell wall biosynthesis
MSTNFITQRTSEEKERLRCCVVVWSVFEVDARVRKYVEALAEFGFSVDVIALSYEKKDKPPRIRKSKNITVYEIDVRRKESTKLSYVRALVKFFILSTYHVSRLQIHRKYAFVHVHTPPDFEVYSVWLPKLMGARVLLDIHDPMPDFVAAKFGSSGNEKLIRILELIERVSLKSADHAVTVTDYWKEVICKRSRIPEDKMSVIVNLPDVKLFDRDRYAKSHKGGRFTLLYPGTVNKHCGLEIALKAVRLVKEKIPLIKFEIYGIGSDYDRIKAMAKELSIDGVVLFHDLIPHDQVPELMAEADVGIALLSGSDEYSRQALNVKLFEYLAMGLPAIATRTPVTEYYLNDQIVAFSNPNDSEDVARCILELYHNPTRRQLLSNGGLEFTRKLNWNVKVADFFEIVEKLVAKGRGNNGMYRPISATTKN